MNALQWLAVPLLVMSALGIAGALLGRQIGRTTDLEAARALLFGGLISLFAVLLIMAGGLL